MSNVPLSHELVEEPSDFGALKPGTRLGRYELLVPVARGGMARVWAARQHGQRGFQKLVAVKTILPQLADEPDFERMFLDEARIASGVHHPNVCEIYELGEEKGTLYMAMEWVSGDSLSRVLRVSSKAEPLDHRVVARILADACAGVHAAHELADDDGRQLGVVHRDLSPHNVLLTADGVAKVCDFGVAKALGQLHDQTTAGQLKGKISYMSPEQVMGARVDRRSDVFSLGSVLYEATTGLRPFQGDREHLVMQAITSGKLDPPSSVVRGYPPELERIVLRALAHEPVLRYPTAERMRFALEEFLTRGPLITQSNVAQVVRARLGEHLDRRKERIRQASSVAEQGGWEPGQVPPTREAQDHRSGVKPSQARFNVSAPLLPPLQAGMGASPPAFGPASGVAGVGNEATIHGYGRPVSSSTNPHAPVALAHAQVDPSSGAPPGPALSSLPAPAGQPSLPPGARVGDGSSSGHRPFPMHAIGPAPGPPGGFPYGAPNLQAMNAPPSPLVEEPPPAARQYALAALIGLIFAGLICGAGVLVWRARAPSRAAVPPVAAESSAKKAAASTATPPPELDVREPIVLEIRPSDAVVLVDGRELPPETRSLPRPPAGKVAIVAVRANGYADVVLQVDASSAATLSIALEPVAAAEGEADASPSTSSAASAAPPESAAKPHARPRPRDPSPDLPDNPY